MIILDSLRSQLYWIGFVATLLFGGRFFLQWIHSEKKGVSLVTRSFWQISFAANLLMCFHGYVQLQYPICIIQGLNATIAWRNLNLMGKRVRSLSTVVVSMVLVSILLTVCFFFQNNSEWMRSPELPWSNNMVSHTTLSWHLLGCFGMLLFASRYWFQWWEAEKHRKSFLGKSFWWISTIGSLFSLLYAIRLKDPVNILGFSIGLIPYLRNLALLKRAKKKLMKEKSNSLFLFAGEQSGDLLGANLLRALKPLAPSLDFYGVGGSEMKLAGLRIFHEMERFQVMGFSSVIAALPRLYRDFRKLKKEILKKNPVAVVLIDYPDFNMLLAKALRKNGYTGKLIHYVCPSVWAWRKNRVTSLAKTLDHLLSILPFEKGCFEKTQLPVTYVGHPLVAAIDQYQYTNTMNFETPVLAIFPGSRKHEIELNLPLQLEAAKRLKGYQLAISVARPELLHVIQKYADASITLIHSEQRYDLMRSAAGALATSGTVALELGLHEVPTVITYKVDLMNTLLARYLFRIKLPFYTLVNITCGKEVFPEHIEHILSSEKISQALDRLLKHPEQCRKECSRLREILTREDASAKAATTIHHLIS